MDLKRSIDRFFRNLGRNPLLGIQYSSGLLVFSLFLFFVVPNMVLRSYRNSSEEGLRQVEVLIQQAEDRIQEQNWFSEDFSITSNGRSFQSDLAEAHAILETSRSTFQDAGRGWPSSRVRRYQQAIVEVQNAKAFVDVTITLFDYNVTLREQVSLNQAEATLLVEQLVSSQNVAETRFGAESHEWLETYMAPLQEELRQSSQKLSSVQQHMNTASGLMPDWNDLSHRGNPTAAQEQITRAKVLIDQINVHQHKVTAGLDYQVEARDGAEPKIVEAEAAINAAWDRLSVINAQYNWGFSGALSVSRQQVLDAAESLKAAKDIFVVSVVDGKVDWPASYEAGKLALLQAQQSVTSANSQVNAYIETNNLLARYSSVHSTAISDIRTAESAWSTIERYHNSSTWNGKQNNISEAWRLVGFAEDAYANTSQSLSNQEFLTAKNQMGGSISNLQEASNLSGQVVSLKNSLEGFRSSWPGKQDRAEAEISSNSSRVSSYGSYSSSARSDFNSAVELLSRANNAANSHQYESACTLADQSYNSAEGTGARAERAYDDEMDRQERAREAAQRAAEEAARQAAESSSSSSSGSCCSSNDGGGFSSGSSSSSSSGSYNDGGGYNSSSGGGYDDGGGY